MDVITLPTPEEFSYEQNLEFLKRSPKELLHSVDGNTVWKALMAEGVPVLFTVAPARGGIAISFVHQPVDEGTKQLTIQYVEEWFDLKNDLKPFYAMAMRDRLLGPLVKKYFGYRIIGQPDLSESITWAIIGQQINLSFAYTLKQRFVERFGERIRWNDRDYYLFPTPKLVSDLAENALLELQFSKQKARYVIAVAQAFNARTLSKEQLTRLSFEDAKAELMKLKGIGNWTANYALMKTFRYPDAFPLEDAGVHNAIRNLKKMDRKPTLDEVKKVFRKYRGWEAYATLYLWKSL